MSLDVSLVGRVSIRADGVLIDEGRFPGRQGRLVFAYLAAEHGRLIARDDLAGALWGETPPATWEKALTVIVSKLRGLLVEAGVDGGSVLKSAFGCYTLELPEGSSVDLLSAVLAAEAAEAALAAGELDEAKAQAIRAVTLARLPLLPGDDGEWVAAKRRELADVLSRALECLAEACLGTGEPIHAAKSLEEAIALDPFRESCYRRLMQAHAAAGNRAEALRVYERCRTFLAEELGAYPSPETEWSYRELLQASSPQPSTFERPEEAAPDGREPEATPSSTSRKRRKTVTMICTELAGWAAVVERLDSEAAHGVAFRHCEQARSVLARHGGAVHAVIGETVIGVFGMSAAHEDDPLRAVRAALELRTELQQLRQDVRRDFGIEIDVKVAINTGEVAIDVGTSLQPMVVGRAFEIARRLLRGAQSGEIVLGAATHRVVANAVNGDPLESAAEEMKGWRLAGLRVEQPRFGSSFVGREHELGALRDAFARTVRDRSCRLCTVAGAPGIGKSRLAREFVAGLTSEATVGVGRCLSYGEGITYWPLREIVRGLAEGGPRDWIEAQLPNDPRGTAVAERVAAALGAGEGGAKPEETFWAFRKLFEAVARERPLVLVIDDIHWAEPTLLDLIENVVGLSGGAPILLLCLARPELFERRPAWSVPQANWTAVPLPPLGDEEARGLVQGLDGARGLSEHARARAVGAAEGNPLFLEQLVAHESEGGGNRLPPGLHALLEARIDRLDPGERALLERAAISGRVFYPAAVSELLPADERPKLGQRLLTLVQRDFIEPFPTVLESEDAFRFRHILLREAAYEALAKESRAVLHERYADWIETRAGEDEIVGYHLEQGVRYRSEGGRLDDRGTEVAVRAAERLGAAGRAALKRGDLVGAVNLCSRATSLPPPEAPVRLNLLPDLGEALTSSGQLDRARTVLEEAVERARTAGDVQAGWRAKLQQAWLRFQADSSVDVTDVLDTAQEAVAEFERLGDDRALAHAWHLIAWVHMDYGHLSALTEAVRRGRGHAQAAGDAMTAEDLTIWALLAGITGPRPAAQLRSEARLELKQARRHGRRRVEGAALLVLAMCAAFGERFPEARELLAEAIAIDDELGGRGSGFRYTPAATIELLAGDEAQAERELREGYETLRERGDAWFLCGVAAELADVLWLQGKDDEAYELTLLSERAVAEDVLVAQMMWRGARAKILARRGQAEEAEALARQGIAIIERTDHVLYTADAWMDLAEVLRLQSQEEDAAMAAAKALHLYERKGNVAAARKVRKLLETLHVARLDAQPAWASALRYPI